MPALPRPITFGLDLPSALTANKRVLIATQAVAATGLVTPDYVMPDRFHRPMGHAELCGRGFVHLRGAPERWRRRAVLERYPVPNIGPNIATNFAGQSASIPAGTITVVEFYHAVLDHYFMTPLSAGNRRALDTGPFGGWSRTGLTFKAYPSQTSAGAGANPVCRFYIPPQHGDSHFYSASPFDCAFVLEHTGTDPNYSGYIEETPNAFTSRCRTSRPVLVRRERSSFTGFGITGAIPTIASRPIPSSKR